MIYLYVALFGVLALGGLGLRGLIYGVSEHLESDDLWVAGPALDRVELADQMAGRNFAQLRHIDWLLAEFRRQKAERRVWIERAGRLAVQAHALPGPLARRIGDRRS